MAKIKGVGANQPASSSQDADRAAFRLLLQKQKELNASQIGELHTSINAFQTTLNTFKDELMAEIRAFRTLKESPAAAVEDSTPLKFGSIPPMGNSTSLESFQDSYALAQGMVSSFPSSQGRESQPYVFAPPCPPDPPDLNRYSSHCRSLNLASPHNPVTGVDTNALNNTSPAVVLSCATEVDHELPTHNLVPPITIAEFDHSQHSHESDVLTDATDIGMHLVAMEEPQGTNSYVSSEILQELCHPFLGLETPTDTSASVEQFKAFERSGSGENSQIRFGSWPPSSGSPTIQAQGSTSSSTNGVSMALGPVNSENSVHKPLRHLNMEGNPYAVGVALATGDGVGPQLIVQSSLSMAWSQMGVLDHERGESSLMGVKNAGEQPLPHHFQNTEVVHYSTGPDLHLSQQHPYTNYGYSLSQMVPNFPRDYLLKPSHYPAQQIPNSATYGLPPLPSPSTHGLTPPSGYQPYLLRPQTHTTYATTTTTIQSPLSHKSTLRAQPSEHLASVAITSYSPPLLSAIPEHKEVTQSGPTSAVAEESAVVHQPLSVIASDETSLTSPSVTPEDACVPTKSLPSFSITSLHNLVLQSGTLLSSGTTSRSPFSGMEGNLDIYEPLRGRIPFHTAPNSLGAISVNDTEHVCDCYSRAFNVLGAHPLTNRLCIDDLRPQPSINLILAVYTCDITHKELPYNTAMGANVFDPELKQESGSETDAPNISPALVPVSLILIGSFEQEVVQHHDSSLDSIISARDYHLPHSTIMLWISMRDSLPLAVLPTGRTPKDQPSKHKFCLSVSLVHLESHRLNVTTMEFPFRLMSEVQVLMDWFLKLQQSNELIKVTFGAFLVALCSPPTNTSVLKALLLGFKWHFDYKIMDFAVLTDDYCYWQMSVLFIVWIAFIPWNDASVLADKLLKLLLTTLDRFKCYIVVATLLVYGHLMGVRGSYGRVLTLPMGPFPLLHISLITTITTMMKFPTGLQLLVVHLSTLSSVDHNPHLKLLTACVLDLVPTIHCDCHDTHVACTGEVVIAYLELNLDGDQSSNESAKQLAGVNTNTQGTLAIGQWPPHHELIIITVSTASLWYPWPHMPRLDYFSIPSSVINVIAKLQVYLFLHVLHSPEHELDFLSVFPLAHTPYLLMIVVPSIHVPGMTSTNISNKAWYNTTSLQMWKDSYEFSAWKLIVELCEQSKDHVLESSVVATTNLILDARVTHSTPSLANDDDSISTKVEVSRLNHPPPPIGALLMKQGMSCILDTTDAYGSAATYQFNILGEQVLMTIFGNDELVCRGLFELHISRMGLVLDWIDGLHSYHILSMVRLKICLLLMLVVQYEATIVFLAMSLTCELVDKLQPVKTLILEVKLEDKFDLKSAAML